VSRVSNAAYLDLEAKLPKVLTLGAAVRGEHYSDFGDIATGKVRPAPISPAGSPCAAQCPPASARLVAAAVFHLHLVGADQWRDRRYRHVPSTSAVAKSLGGQALRPEKSVNFSAGTVIRFGGFDLTVDGYLIKVRDGLGLSENLTLSAADQAL
jgi:iron complex outermembrane receptor protein